MMKKHNAKAIKNFDNEKSHNKIHALYAAAM